MEAATLVMQDAGASEMFVLTDEDNEAAMALDASAQASRGPIRSFGRGPSELGRQARPRELRGSRALEHSVPARTLTLLTSTRISMQSASAFFPTPRPPLADTTRDETWSTWLAPKERVTALVRVPISRAGREPGAGSLYLYPHDEADVDISMWVRGDAWSEDSIVARAGGRGWIDDEWPFERVLYRGR